MCVGVCGVGGDGGVTFTVTRNLQEVAEDVVVMSQSC